MLESVEYTGDSPSDVSENKKRIVKNLYLSNIAEDLCLFQGLLFLEFEFFFLTSFSSKYYFLLAIMQQPAIRVQDTIREAA